jgi:hypothetical protein
MAILFQKRFRRMKRKIDPNSSMPVLQEENRVKTSLLPCPPKKNQEGWWSDSSSRMSAKQARGFELNLEYRQ